VVNKREHRAYSKQDIQKTILPMIKDIDRFCKKHEIDYYLMSGSALGAMRHRGFIPWDDDLDIAMTKENYEKFIELFDQEKDESKYLLQYENTKEWPLFLTRVCLKGTTMVSNEFKYNFKQHHTVFVDIKHLFIAPNGKMAHWIQYMASQLLRVNALAICNFPTKSLLKKIALKTSKIVVNHLTRPLLITYINKYEGASTKYFGYYFGRERYKHTGISRDIVGKPRYVEFEDTLLPVFEKVEEYLERRFGDKWMEMPSQEVKSQYPSHSDFVDLEKDYTKYLNEDRTKWLY